MAEAPPTWVTVLGDMRLSREARLMALHLVSLGAGEHRVSTEGWQEVLGATARGYPKRASIATHIQELVFAGWLRRREGGSGSPFYAIALQYPQGTPAVFPCPSGDGRAETAPVPSGDAKTSPIPSGDVFRAPPGTGEPHVVVGDVVVDVEGVAHAHAKRYSLDPRVRDLLDNPDVDTPPLNGCRGAIVDYLEGRVMGPGQVGYVRSIQAWLRGGSGTPRGRYGGLLDVQNPIHLIATGLNDLLTEDETKYKSGRGQVGVIATLRTKLSVLIDQELAPHQERTAQRPTGTSARRPRPDISHQGSLD